MTDENLMLPFSEACERNKRPILDALRRILAGRSHVLEIGSGTGQHAVYFAANLQHVVWQPSERSAQISLLQSRIRLQGGDNLLTPAVLDVAQRVWPVLRVEAIFTANTLHIMSWSEVEAMFAGIDSALDIGGVLCAYGPFRYRGKHTSESNERFDGQLRERDPRSGIRDIDEVLTLAAASRLQLRADHEMPANNRLLEFVRTV